MSEPRYVSVIWDDAWAEGDDVTHETVREKHNPLEMETRGWLLYEDERGVSIFPERCRSDASFRGRSFIPRGMIKSIEDFPPIRKKRKRKEAPIDTKSPI